VRLHVALDPFGDHAGVERPGQREEAVPGELIIAATIPYGKETQPSRKWLKLALS
jgi:hypothetical protein